MALALGARVTLISRIPPIFDAASLAGIDVHALPANDVCRYDTRYDDDGNRTLLLLSEGESISHSDITLRSGVDALIVAPAYHEIAGLPPSDAQVQAVALQGPLRTSDQQGVVTSHAGAAGQAKPFLRQGVLAFFSEEDTADPGALARFVARKGGIALLTRGWRGATLVTADRERVLPSLPANPIDPTGAGDCFATAFVVRYAETHDLDEAARFALAAGALAVEAPGLAGVATRRQVEERLREAA